MFYMHVCMYGQETNQLEFSTKLDKNGFPLTLCLECDHVLCPLRTRPNATLRLFLSDNEQHKVSEQMCVCAWQPAL